MKRTARAPYGGAVGEILSGTSSLPTLLTGSVLALALALGGLVLEDDRAALLFGQAVIGLALARLAINATAGDRCRTVLSTHGGSWTDAGTVALRFVVLSAGWLVPALGLGLSVPRRGIDFTAASAVTAFGPSLGFAVGALLTPPLFLIVASRASRFTEVFSLHCWRDAFAGRSADLHLLYAVHIGATALVLAFATTLSVAVTAWLGWQPGVLLAGVSAAYLVGFSVSLLGRLCGAFVADALAPDGTPAAMTDRGGLFSVRREPREVSTSVATQAAVTADGVDRRVGLSEGTPERVLARVTALPPLLDPTRWVAQARALFERDPAAAVARLEELRSRHAPSPHLLHGLAVLRHDAGDVDGAVCVAREAIELCFERRQVHLAADLFRVLRGRVGELGLGSERLLEVGSSLRRTGDLRSAANAFACVLRREPGDLRAIKGMLAAAELMLRQENAPGDARQLYQYLLQHCPPTNLTEHMRAGFIEAETRLGQAPPAAGPA